MFLRYRAVIEPKRAGMASYFCLQSVKAYMHRILHAYVYRVPQCTRSRMRSLLIVSRFAVRSEH